MSDALSLLALIVSAFTLYWTTFHKRRSFYLIRLDTLVPGLEPEFALVNAGKHDILVTRVACGFEHGNGTTYPAQTLTMDGEESLLLQAGKASRCRVRFPEPLTGLAKVGEQEVNGTVTLYKLRMKVEVEWVDSHGDDHRRHVWLYRYGLTENGDIHLRSPLTKRAELYRGP